MQITLSGPESELEIIVQAIKDELSAQATIQQEPRERQAPLSRTTFGLEPWQYAVIAFGSHLSADIAHDLIKSLIKRVIGRLAQTKSEITNRENEKDSSTTG